MSWQQAIRKGTDRPPAEDVLILGPHGTGKSTFARGAPDPIVICADGHEAADMPDDVPNITPVRWDDPDDQPFDPSSPSMLGFLRMLAREEHSFKSVVVDTLTAAQSFCEAQVCAKQQVTVLSEILGWNKGTDLLTQAWKEFVALLEECNKRGLNVIRVAHVEVKKFKNPNGEDWNQFVAQLHPSIAMLASQGASNVLFSLPEMHAARVGEKRLGNEKTIGAGTGKFILRTTYSATVAGKERLYLPDEMDVSWAAFEIAAKQGRKIRTGLDRALRTLPLGKRAEAEKYLSDNRYSRDAALTIIAGVNKSKNGKSEASPATDSNNTSQENTAS